LIDQDDLILMFNSNYDYLAPLMSCLILKNTATLKSQSGVNQCHWNWYHTMDSSYSYHTTENKNGFIDSSINTV